MTKKVSVLLIIALMLSLCGCQLAKGEELVETGYDMTDKLIGVFVTRDYLSLFDMEAYLEDNLDSIMSGKTLSAAEQAEYEGRIYATPQGYLENGKPDGHFTFEGLEGYAYFVPLAETEEASSHIPNSDSCFADIKIGTHVKDDNVTENSVEATMYVVDDLEDYSFFLNPVYQDENGNVYLMAGTGISSNSLGTMSKFLDSEVKTTVDGVETIERFSVKINFKGVPHPKRIVLLQMDADSNVLHREEYLPGQLPEQLDPADGAEYIVVETHSDTAVTREIVSQEERWLHTYDPQENGICTKQQTEVLWKAWDA